MPFKLIETDVTPLLIDYEYEIVDKDLLAQYVAEMVLGNHFHVVKIINALEITLPIQPNESINKVIEKIENASKEKRDGWLFQMISWIVLALRHKGQNFHANYPHFAPAQHGIDGLAVTLNPDNSLKSIIITEDKCTTYPRNLITQQVFPEFKAFEDGDKNNALMSIISCLLGTLDSGKILEEVQNNIYQNKFRVYRIGITRESEHNSLEGRNKLFLNYEANVSGTSVERRTGATIHLNDMRNWMDDFSDKVIACLKSKKV